MAREALESGEQDHTDDRVSHFFRTRVATFIKMPWNRLVLFLVFFGWIAVAAWQTSTIEPTKETEQFLDEDHPLQKSFTILNSEFPTADSDTGLKVYFTWGLGLVDREGVNLLFDPEYLGEINYLDTFDFNEKCQAELVTACDKLKTEASYVPYIKRDGKYPGILLVSWGWLNSLCLILLFDFLLC